MRELRYPGGGAALHEGMELLHGAVRYKVSREPELQNDGRELLARLSQVHP